MTLLFKRNLPHTVVYILQEVFLERLQRKYQDKKEHIDYHIKKQEKINDQNQSVKISCASYRGTA